MPINEDDRKFLEQAKAALRRGDRMLARRIAQRIVANNPDEVEGWLFLGGLSNPKASLAYLKKAQEIASDNPRVNKALILAQRGELDETQQVDLDKTQEIHRVPKPPEFRVNPPKTVETQSPEFIAKTEKPRKPNEKRPHNITAFVIIWLGQFVSMAGSFMTSFALGIWAWEKTGSAQALALVGVFTYAPLIIVTPMVGVLVDRWNRKLVMMLSDLGAVLSSVVVFILFTSGKLEIWHIYATTAFASAFQAFQWPAYSASVTLMIPKKHYSRASGMLSMVESASNIIGPVLAGALIGVIGVNGILLIDIVTFFVAIFTLLIVVVPQPVVKKISFTFKRFWRDATFGFRFIFSRPGLLGLQLVFLGANFMTVIGWAVISPMVLARTGSAQILGFVESFAAVGGLVGAVFLTIWGGPKQLVFGILLGWVLNGLLGRFLMGITQQPWIWMVSVFLLAFFMPIINGCNQALWQKKVPPDHQGRVFTVRRFIAQITIPISMALSGWLADHVFEPAFQTASGWGTRLFSSLVGTGHGAGFSLMIAISGIMVTLVGLVGTFFTAIRDVETRLPDYDLHEDHNDPVRLEFD